MERRDFIKLLGSLPFVAMYPDLAFASAPQADYGKLLVLFELKGGNDGLNTVIPYSDSNYYDLRPRIAIARDKVLQLDGDFGFHPGMQALMPLWQQGEIAVVQGVGYPEPNLSHFRSIEIWDSASGSSEYLTQGWLSRLFARSPLPGQTAADGIVVGSQDLGPFSGGARAITLNNPEQFHREAKDIQVQPDKTPNAALAHILKVESDITQAARGLIGNYAFKTEFPKTQLGNALKTAAQVVATRSGIVAIKVTHNGFDTHRGQTGTQSRLLQEMAEGIVAFKSALQEIDQWNSTLIMSYSEFGRRASENASNGTDHGTANVHFMIGGKVKGGLYGKSPKLNQLDGGNLVYGVDFRSLYATAMEKWWGIESTREVLGGRFPTLDILKT